MLVLLLGLGSAGLAIGPSAHGAASVLVEPDSDGDGLTDAEEVGRFGTSPTNPDTDADKIWDGDEIRMFGSNPVVADTDGDAMPDGADPQPTVPNAPVHGVHAIFKHDLTTGHREMVSGTFFQTNHVVYAPITAPGAPYLIYQTYLSDWNGDGNFDEADLTGTAIGAMDLEGGHRRLLTDLDEAGRLVDNGFIDAVPYPSPDGRYIIFSTDRDGARPRELRLWIMDIDGANPRPLTFENPDDEPLPLLEMDADPHWSAQGKISFKREGIEGLYVPRSSGVCIADIDPVTATLSNLTARTEVAPQVLTNLPPGDFDPKISPDGRFIASYRKFDDDLVVGVPPHEVVIGDFDLWVGLASDPLQPGNDSITPIHVSSRVAEFMPRWNAAGDKLAYWFMDADAAEQNRDAVDVGLIELNVQADPDLSVQITNVTNLTNGPLFGTVWSESMPAWSTVPGEENALVYSAQRVTCTDGDGDGFGIQGSGCAPHDCDDADSSVHPGADEICDNGKDDDCDGVRDSFDPDCGELVYCSVLDEDSGDTEQWFFAESNIVQKRRLGAVNPGWQFGASADFDGDGTSDYAFIDPDFTAVGMAMADPQGTLSFDYAGTLAPDVRIVGAGDLNADGKADLLLKDPNAQSLFGWMMDGAAIVRSTAIGGLPPERSVVGVGNLDGDGDDDIVLYDESTRRLSLLVMRNGLIRSFENIATTSAGTEVLAVDDFTGDGRDDLLIRDGETQELRIWEMSKKNIVSVNPLLPIPSPWRGAGTADFFFDGNPDLLIRLDGVEALAIVRLDGVELRDLQLVEVLKKTEKMLGCVSGH
ncbi:MAG: PD40 domain-containing protein [Myxococcales bacterium]|nr:PD40 domain-containing protein [Myxococcales bacterium]